ncbi:facilitated trehalose transporter Tret1-like [Chrysoperla carnea]|uniref:facilitated trehalose transporter Tret1-like n=1 Tax=Chrysoperla carnea TaxID=189513 RepID=UPI001D08B85D|nr:facilitated trehalose transporter Tret1-like [Chrysoperla carnea]
MTSSQMEDKKKKVSVISRLTLVLETPHKRNQYLAGFLATIAMFMTGNVMGWSSPVQIKLKNDETPFYCTEDQWGWAVSFYQLGTAPWSIFAGTFADILGRRLTLLLAGPIFLVAWTVAFFSYNCSTLMVSRLIAGGGSAIGSAVCALYIGEICEPAIRGRVGALVMIMNNSGVLFSYVVGPYVSYKTFVLILFIIPFIFIITFCWMPETPYFRLRQGKRDEAMKCLLKFRGLTDDQQLDNELDTMKKGVDSEMQNKTSVIELFKQPITRKAMILLIGVKTMQHFSGVSAIQSYMQNIFEEADSFIPASFAAIVCVVVQLISGFFTSYFVDRFGRKPLLLSSCSGTAVALFSVGLYFFLKDYIECDVTSISWLPLVSIMLFMIVQTIGVGTLSYIFLSEIFPTNLRGSAALVGTMYGSLAGFAVTKLFSVISNALDIFVTFWMCSIIMICGIIFTIFFVFETKGKSLVQIQNELSNKANNRLVQVTA